MTGPHGTIQLSEAEIVADMARTIQEFLNDTSNGDQRHKKECR
jgi:hypothetical protein